MVARRTVGHYVGFTAVAIVNNFSSSVDQNESIHCKNIRISTDRLFCGEFSIFSRNRFPHCNVGTGRFADTNVYGTGPLKYGKLAIPVDIRIFLQDATYRIAESCIAVCFTEFRDIATFEHEHFTR